MLVKFRLVNKALGEYRGLLRFETAGAGETAVELVTWLKPNRPVPIRLLLVVERIAMLQASREFLKRCEARPSASSMAPPRQLTLWDGSSDPESAKRVVGG